MLIADGSEVDSGRKFNPIACATKHLIMRISRNTQVLPRKMKFLR